MKLESRNNWRLGRWLSLLDSQQLCKSWVQQHMHATPSVGRTEVDRCVKFTGQPASQSVSSRFRKRICLKKIGWRALKEIPTIHSLASTCTHPHAHVHTATQTCTIPHIQKYWCGVQRNNTKLSMWHLFVSPPHETLMQEENHKFRVSLGSIVSSCLRRKRERGYIGHGGTLQYSGD